MIIIGLTGSIGMGKTTVAGMFADYGAKLHDADEEVHKLLSAGGEGLKALQNLLPPQTSPQIYQGESINRRALGDLVFADDELRSKLEALLHPLVRNAQQEFIEKQKQAGTSIVILGIPLLFETGADKFVDVTIVVSAPYDIQRTRVLARPGMSEKKFEAILTRQMSDAEKRRCADYVIDTGTELERTKAQVEEIINRLKA